MVGVIHEPSGKSVGIEKGDKFAAEHFESHEVLEIVRGKEGVEFHAVAKIKRFEKELDIKLVARELVVKRPRAEEVDHAPCVSVSFPVGIDELPDLNAEVNSPRLVENRTVEGCL